MSKEVIDLSISWAEKKGGISWDPHNEKARSGLVKHPRDSDLRIDLQGVTRDGEDPTKRWANFQLQDGARGHRDSNTYAHILLACGLSYLAEDVREAWMASLEQAMIAKLTWIPFGFHFRIISAISSIKPRYVSEIVNRMTGTDVGSEAYFRELVYFVKKDLKTLVAAGFVRRMPPDVRPYLGDRFVRSQKLRDWMKKASLPQRAGRPRPGW
jgi:hypothetical protein